MISRPNSSAGNWPERVSAPRYVQTADIREPTHDDQSRPPKTRSPRAGLRTNRDPGVQGRRDRLFEAQGERRGEGSGATLAASALGGFVAELARAVADELESRLKSQVATALQSQRTPPLLDRRGLAEALNCGVDTVDKLRASGLPQLLVGDAPRFELDRALNFLRERSGR